jgi:Na+/melibiose symporter-like transporter
VAFWAASNGRRLADDEEMGQKDGYLIGAAIGIVECSAMYFVPKENVHWIWFCSQRSFQ